MLYQQNYADIMKGFVLADKQAREDKHKRAMIAIQRFEGAPWHEPIFKQAQDSINNVIDFKKQQYNGEDASGDVRALLEYYLFELMMLNAVGEDRRILGTQEVVEQFGIPIDTLKKHTFRTGRIISRQIGNARVYSAAEIKRFLAEPVIIGRPKQSAV